MRRIIFYLFYDKNGVVDDYVTYKLNALRPHADHIFVVANSSLTPESRQKLEDVADTVFCRENIGFDVWAYKEAMQVYGLEGLEKFDELILMNYTFFGPIYPFEETFARMDAQELDFWGLTGHKSIDPNPFSGATGVLPRHIQSHWIAVRKRMFTSLEFKQYWSNMPMIRSYDDSVLSHEARFAEHFEAKGFRLEIAFPPEDYPSDHPIFDSASLMLANRCPILKRRIFFHEPAYLDRNAIIGKRLMEQVRSAGYPTELIWRNVVRTAQPRTLYTNFSLLEIASDLDDGWRPEPGLRIAVICHMYYDDMTAELASYISRIPMPFDLYVTTDTSEKAARIRARLAEAGLPPTGVRTLDSNRGRETSAFLVGCRDLLEPGRYDLICKIHSKKSAQDGHNAGTLFKHHMLDNLLSSTGYVAHILRMFAEEPTLGMAFPPVVNIAYPTLGHAWFHNLAPAHEMAERLGIRTEFDSNTPVAPYGGMFWFRPEALTKLTSYTWRYEDFPTEEGWLDGGLAHVIERLYGYVAMDAQYHLRSVMNTDWAAINYAFLEYKLQRVSAMMPAYNQEQVDYLHRVREEGPLLLHLKRAVDKRYPAAGRSARPAYRAVRRVYRSGRRLLNRG